MSQVIGVHLRTDEVCFARFEFERDQPPVYLAELRVPRSAFTMASTDFVEGNTGSEVVVPDDVRFFLGEAVDAEVVAVFDPKRLVSERGSFPFRDPRKVDQVASLQLEEELPFDLTGFVLDVALEVSEKDGEFPALLVAVPQEEIAEHLAFLKALELDPAILTPAVVGLAGISDLLAESEVSIVVADSNRFSFMSARAGVPVFLRDCPVVGEEMALSEVLPTVLSAKRSLEHIPGVIYSVGRKLRFPLEGVRTDLLVTERLGLTGRIAHLDRSLLSLLGAANARINRSAIPNFRKGQFRYRGSYRQILAPLWEERRYLLTLVVCLFFWLGTALYASASKRSLLDERINAAVQKVFPGEVVPEGQELPFVQARVAQLEARLKGLGSVSSLSPLEAFRELSTIVSPNVDVAFDSISIGTSSITFGGTVADTGTVGRLIGVLEKHQDRFCSIKVEPRGNVPGGTRVRIVSELKYCP